MFRGNKKALYFFLAIVHSGKQNLFGTPSLPTYNEATASEFLRC